MLKIYPSNIELINMRKKKDPKLPEIVLFGLIFVNFGPLKIFPKRIPPISEDIHINNIINKIILK